MEKNIQIFKDAVRFAAIEIERALRPQSKRPVQAFILDVTEKADITVGLQLRPQHAGVQSDPDPGNEASICHSGDMECDGGLTSL